MVLGGSDCVIGGTEIFDVDGGELRLTDVSEDWGGSLEGNQLSQSGGGKNLCHEKENATADQGGLAYTQLPQGAGTQRE